MDEDLNPKVEGEGFKFLFLQLMIPKPLNLSKVALSKLPRLGGQGFFLT